MLELGKETGQVLFQRNVSLPETDKYFKTKQLSTYALPGSDRAIRALRIDIKAVLFSPRHGNVSLPNRTD
jgi:hypothetical protein